MATIAEQNTNQIRAAMDIHCGLAARVSTDLSFTISGDVAAVDSNVSTSLDTEEWSMRSLADFQGEGFPLDGSCELCDTSVAGSLNDGKLGARSDIGGTLTITATASAEFTAVTIEIASGTGTITANGVAYEIRRAVIVPVNSTSVTLTITSSDADRRVEIASITPGIALEFTSNNLISVDLDLRSDLSIIGGELPISAIEISAYWPDDISESISNIADDVPIWYYAGYAGDYSKMRYFYLSEPATQVDGILTIRGEDAVGKLEDADSVPLRRLDTQKKQGHVNLYNWFKSIITGAGIKLVSAEAAPAASGSDTTISPLLLTEASPRSYVQDVMSLAHTGTFWPVFVDAGIPRITWSKPVSKWDIYEEDCGEITQVVDRNLAKIRADGDYGISNTVTRDTAWTVIQKDITIKAGTRVTRNFSDQYYWQYSVAYKRGNSFVWALPNTVQWIASKTSEQKTVTVNGKKTKQWYYSPTLYGKKLNIESDAKSITPSPKRPGQTAKVTPLAIGKLYKGSTLIYPNYSNLFAMSNIKGSFVWKGNPKMQPRDVFTFHRLDGTLETCTIESIEIKHEEGGTKATITYRLGVV